MTISSQSYILERSVSDNAFPVYAKIANWYDNQSPYEKIYVSRSRLSGQRKLLNEAEVENLFQENGFKIVHPEAIPFPEQVNIFANAKIIAGPSGSAMYNAIYGKKKEQLVILASDRFITLNDTLLNSNSACSVEYLCGKSIDDTQAGMSADWVIDLNLVSSYIRANSMT